MKQTLFLFMLSLCAAGLRAQTSTVIDQNSRQMLQEVIIRSDNPPLWTYTDAKGRWDAGAFKEADTVRFTKPGYKTLSLPYANLKEMEWLVQLVPSPFALGEAVVSANRWEDSKLKSPNRIETIGVKEVEFQNPQNAADMLALSGYAYVQKSQMGGGSPMLRGFAANRVLLVVDGVRMNTAIFRSGNVQNVISLDANAIERSEVFFGPGGVMYGSDAIGGVMNFSTIKPRFSNDSAGKAIVSGRALARTSTANSESTMHMDFNIGLHKWAFVTSVTAADYGDLRSGRVGGDDYFYRPHFVQTINNVDYMVRNADSTLQVGSKYSQINMMQKIRYQPNEHWELDYAFHFSETSDFNRYDRLYIIRPQTGNLRWAEWYYGPQKWNMHRLGITHTRTTRAFDRIRMTAAAQHFEESRTDRQFASLQRNMQRETVEAFSVNVDAEKKAGEKLTIYYGGEMVYNAVGSVAAITDISTNNATGAVTRYPDGSTWATAGLYANAQYEIAKSWLLTVGARYSTYRITADFDTTFFPFPFTTAEMSNGGPIGSMGIVGTPTETWQVYANLASGFRAPNIDDMGKVFESTPGFLVVPNPKLKPESVYNAEIGAMKVLGDWAKVDVAAYHTWLRDAMVRRDFTLNGLTEIEIAGDTSRIEALQNIAEIRAFGLQAGAEFQVKGFGLRSNISVQQGKEQSPDSLIFYPLRHAPPTFGSTHLWFAHKKFRLEAYAIYNARLDYDQLALTERVNQSYAKDASGRNYSAAWYTLNFKAAYYANEHLTLTAGAENIMDILYRPYSSGINAPGRNLIVALSAKF